MLNSKGNQEKCLKKNVNFITFSFEFWRLREGDYGSGDQDRVICLQVHGDAAVSGFDKKSFSETVHILKFEIFFLKGKELFKKLFRSAKCHILVLAVLST